jgi:hypothetical protein
MTPIGKDRSMYVRDLASNDIEQMELEFQGSAVEQKVTDQDEVGLKIEGNGPRWFEKVGEVDGEPILSPIDGPDGKPLGITTVCKGETLLPIESV